MATRDLNDLYRRVINSSDRLQQLREMRAPDIMLRNENRILEGAIYALLDDNKIAQVVADVSANAFINDFNHVAGTENRHPIAVTESAARVA